VACFRKQHNLVIFKNYNEAITKTSSDYSNLSINEAGETWAGFGDGNLINDSRLGKAKVPGLIVN